MNQLDTVEQSAFEHKKNRSSFLNNRLFREAVCHHESTPIFVQLFFSNKHKLYKSHYLRMAGRKNKGERLNFSNISISRQSSSNNSPASTAK